VSLKEGAFSGELRPRHCVGGDWVTAWFGGDVKLPAVCEGRKVFVRFRVPVQAVSETNLLQENPRPLDLRSGTV